MAIGLRDRDTKRVRAGEVAFGPLRNSGSVNMPQHLRTYGPEVRTCTECGEHVPFRIDPIGSWAECTACGHLN